MRHIGADMKRMEEADFEKSKTKIWWIGFLCGNVCMLIIHIIINMMKISDEF